MSTYGRFCSFFGEGKIVRTILEASVFFCDHLERFFSVLYYKHIEEDVLKPNFFGIRSITKGNHWNIKESGGHRV